MHVESLVEQCQHYIVMHLEEFPISHLSLLPLSTRKDILYRLPIADICVHLENTEFTTGLDMAAFWNSTWNHDYVGAVDSPHDREDVKHFVQDKWPGGNTEYARETIYGVVASCAIGHITDSSPQRVLKPAYGPDVGGGGGGERGIPVAPFLYAVRKTCVHGHCQVEFPPRYSDKSEKDLTMYEVENCFSHGSKVRGFPRIFPEFELSQSRLYCANLDYVYFLQNAVYLGIIGSPFYKEGIEFLKAVVKEATNLEVLVLDHWGDEYEREAKFFDEFCAYLSSCQTFLSKFRLLKILSSMYSTGFIISRNTFNQFITAYFAAPTDHVQKLHITYTKIKCSDISCEYTPTIEQRYRSFKTIELGDCQFVSEHKATPESISHWLGESISELPQTDPKPVEPDTYFFRVGDKSARKRKFSELETEDHDQAER